MTVTLTLLGTGSSGGVPRVGNDWGLCDPNEPRNKRSRCALLVEKAGENGCTTVLIDAGPDIREQLNSANVTHVDAVLFTHAHADHLHGIDDLRGFWVKTHNKVPVFMDAPTFERAQTAFGYCFKTPPGSNYPPILKHHLIDQGSKIEIDGAGGKICFDAFEVVHGEINALGFKTEGAAYIPDVSDIPDRSLKYLENLDLLILDCLRRRPHPSHICLDEALEWTKRLSPEKAIFTNLFSDLDYNTLRAELPDGIVPAYDGMQVDLVENSAKSVFSPYAEQA
ncbi:MBL fold metallo-hydrolase [Roseibium sp. SCPC15]|uniref:MBL fold metallo-hydrolase n=1 Tax=Roseibium sp. SCP15 TaxID=3141376 RepID=UPI003336AA7B